MSDESAALELHIIMLLDKNQSLNHD